ncbi:hypothetical protein [Streptomyces sp. NBC_00443]|uniref:hypothetical protein n=1 Tax=Streptomyces sp. NBC_00443 TaxID=2975743 RepID=UPI002E238412
MHVALVLVVVVLGHVADDVVVNADATGPMTGHAVADDLELVVVVELLGVVELVTVDGVQGAADAGGRRR